MRLRPARAVIGRVHSGHNRQQHLRCADVAGRLLAADVLLARLKRQAIRGLPFESFDTPMIRPGILRTYSALHDINAACGPPPSHRHAESLSASNGDVRAPFAGRFDQAAGEQVRRENHERAGIVSSIDDSR
jgi:hypothetical protein